MTINMFRYILNNSNTRGATSGAGAAWPSDVTEFTRF